MATLTVLEWLNVVGVIAGLIALIATCVNFLYDQRADMNQRIDDVRQQMDRRTESLERAIGKLDQTMLEVKADIREIKDELKEIKDELKETNDELKKTSDLLNADLSWRYLYQNDPNRKYLAPRYHPDTRTLEFVDTRTGTATPVRKP